MHSQLTLAYYLQLTQDLVFQLDESLRFVDVQIPDPSLAIYQPDEVIGKALANILPGPIASKITTALLRAKTLATSQTVSYLLHVERGQMRFQANCAFSDSNKTYTCIVRHLEEYDPSTQSADDAFIQATINALPQAVMRLDSNWRVIDVNKAWHRLFPAQPLMTNQYFGDMFSEADRRAIEEKHQQGATDWQYLVEDVGASATRYLQLSMERIEGFKSYLCSITDISAQILADRRAVSQKQLHEQLINNAHEAFVLFSRAGGVRQVNPAFEMLAGISQIEARQLVFTDLIQNLDESSDTAIIDGRLGKIPVECRLSKLPDGDYFVVVRDIRGRLKRQAQLELMQQAMQQMQEAVVMLNEHQEITWNNQAFTTLVQLETDNAVGQIFSRFLAQSIDTSNNGKLWQKLLTNGYWQGEFDCKALDGSLTPAYITLTMIRTGEGLDIKVVAVITEISEIRAIQQQLRRQAQSDALTGLSNRSHLQDHVQHALKRAERNNKPLSLLHIDLDHFKRINDSLGHHIGDQLLQAVAKKLRQRCRADDLIARMGGDEFMLLLEETSKEGARALAGELIEMFTKPVVINPQQSFMIGMSIGSATYPNDGKDFTELYRASDAAMYRAKSTGKNRYVAFIPTLQTHASRRFLIEQGLRNSDLDQEFHLVYQPQINVVTKSLDGIEALLRWQHPTEGSISPSEFIPVAEETGLIPKLGKWVFERSIKDMGKLITATDESFHLAMNVSAGELHERGFIDNLVDLCARYKVPRNRIEVELTESLALTDLDSTQHIFSELRGLGFQIALDDFGTGYSSLAYLAQLQVDRLKIDKRFVDGVAHNENDSNIVLVIASLADLLGFELIAEGVETLQQAEQLVRLGCIHVQGFYFARPMHANRLLEWYDNFIHHPPPLPQPYEQGK